MNRRLQLGLLFLGVFVGLCVLFLFRSERSNFNVSRSFPKAPVHEPSLEAPSGFTERRESTTKDEPRLLAGIVRSTDGHPIEGVGVLWLALEVEDTEPTPALLLPNWRVPQRKFVEADTDSDGAFAFAEPPPELMFGSVLIALHPAYYPGGLDLLDETVEWSRNAEITLEPAPSITVEVIDTAGKPQSGVTVHHAVVPRRPTPDYPSVRIHERFFAQNTTTGANGRVGLSAFRGEQALWAEKGELVSVPWQGTNPTSVVLTLGESFTIGGTISLPELEDENSGSTGERRILVSGSTGNLWRPLACLRDVREGEWGPLRIPLNGVSRYKVRLEGAPVIPVQEAFDRPKPSSHQRIDFVATRGVDLYLDVQDESGKPVPTAHAEGWWEATMLPDVSVVGEALPDGGICLRTLPPGWIRFRVAAPRYTTQELDVTISDTARFPVTLQRGGGVSGRCVHDGQPVADFQVIYWKAGNLQIYRSKSFLGREDGRFEIDGLAPGDWSIHAASPRFPAGRPLTVNVKADDDSQVELELPTAIRGGGRIMAADTGEPVHNARVQPYSSGGLERSLPWGPVVLTGHDGSFDVDAFVLGLNHITIEAEGFAFAELESRATNNDFLDWGDVRLFRPQTLQISLLGLESLQGLQAEDLRARTEDGYILPERRFDREGVVRFPDVPPGDHRLLVCYPDDSWGRLQLRLEPGKEWSFDLKVAGDRKLSVHVVDERKQVRAPVSGVYVTAQEETGVFVVRFAWINQGSASFEGIRAAQGQVWLLDTENNIVTTRDATFREPVNSIEIRVGEKPFRVRVVDSDRVAIPGAWVTIRSSTGIEFHGADDSGADGWAELGGLPAGALLMDVQHAVAGRRIGVPIDASMDELEFVLQASGALELEVVDGTEPLVGVATRIETTAGYNLGGENQTDDQGHVRYESLGEGNYHLACRRSDCWPAFVDEELAAGEQARVQVQMRRLADLDFILLSADGLPVSGMPVEIHSTEFDLPIETWIQQERVRAPEGLKTNGKGSIRVEGLPRGEYNWSLTVDGEAVTGSFDLAPAQDNRVLASLPPARR